MGMWKVRGLNISISFCKGNKCSNITLTHYLKKVAVWVVGREGVILII